MIESSKYAKIYRLPESIIGGECAKGNSSIMIKIDDDMADKLFKDEVVGILYLADKKDLE